MRSFRFPVQSRRNQVLVLLALGVSALGGCSSLQSSDSTLLGLITPYRIEVVQGNVLTKEQVALVKPGQNRTQVRDILGSPLLTDTFHGDRWDYVFTIRRQGTEPQQRQVVVYFDGETLKSIQGAESLPAERDFVNSIDNAKSSRSPKPLALTPEQLKELPVPVQAAMPASAPEGPVRAYPPLERS